MRGAARTVANSSFPTTHDPAFPTIRRLARRSTRLFARWLHPGHDGLGGRATAPDVAPVIPGSTSFCEASS